MLLSGKALGKNQSKQLGDSEPNPLWGGEIVFVLLLLFPSPSQPSQVLEPALLAGLVQISPDWEIL